MSFVFISCHLELSDYFRLGRNSIKCKRTVGIFAECLLVYVCMYVCMYVWATTYNTSGFCNGF